VEKKKIIGKTGGNPAFVGWRRRLSDQVRFGSSSFIAKDN
jgi:hypothetical protein